MMRACSALPDSHLNDEKEQMMKLKLALVLLFLFIALVPARSRLPQKSPEVVPAINVGMVAPDFTLEDSQGRKVTLADEVKNRPVVLVFYRGYW
jgi:cytochrome oxidase Cu insertion factor (SCO1/SenC/PrrC family)